MANRELDTTSVGLLVPAILERHASATVLAAFERSFYLEAGRDLIAIGDASLHDGPLNIRLRTEEARAALTAELGIVPGQHWQVRRQQLGREGGVIIDLETASIWQPDPIAIRVDNDRLRSSFDRLYRCLSLIQLPQGSLIHLVLDGATPKSPVERAAALSLTPLLQALCSGFSGSPAIDVTPAIDLLGLGPGLTPAGDDLLAGLLIACRTLGENDVAGQIGEALLDAGAARTTDISLAHLRAAALGYGAAPLHDLLTALLADKPLLVDQALDAASKIGHSSGFDAVGGIILTLRAWLDAGHLRSPSN
ncbi:MAG: DUF2877 domain-containing protein [Geminicoccaceae bacterium]